MAYALVFAALGALLLGNAAVAEAAWARWGLLWLAADSLGVAAAYGGAGPRVFGKGADGRVAWASRLLFLPFRLLNDLLFALKVRYGTEPPWHAVAPKLYLGRRPLPGDRAAFERMGVRAVLDLTAECPAPPFVLGSLVYLAVPLLDALGPTPDELETAVAFLEERVAQGTVYVHCASGHGRSATVVAAWLLASGAVPGVAEAEARLRAVRPGVRLTGRQRAALAAAGWR